MGEIVLCPTPIGNLEDITLRALRLLAEADLVLAEDTRRTRKLFQRYELHAPILSCHDRNEAERARQAVELCRAGRRVALVSDAGTPGLSDPGYRVVRAALEAGVRVTALPGPNALLPALTLAGVPIDAFLFLGFLPRRAGPRDRTLAAALASPYTFAFYEAPHRLVATLRAVAHLGGAGRAAAVARELTKIHETVHRGTVAELAEQFGASAPLGELTVVVARA
jgi:16S rRNA (cytidine1402-2'-O)-methyltransferase